jgi:dienelactone hydrolase
MGDVTLDLDEAERLRGELQSFLGVQPPQAPPNEKVLSSSQEDGFARHLVHLVTEDDAIPSLLAVPSGAGPFPAVVVFHQHAGQRHFGKSEVFGLIGDRYQAFGPALARAGFAVLAPDSIAFEDRRPGGQGTDPRDDDWDQHSNALAYRLVTADTLMRKVLEDAMAAVSALVARADVETDAVAALGHSYGGNTTLFLTAVDERVRFGCASGALASYRRKMTDGTGIEMAEVIPGFTTRFDIEHVLAAIAPRRFLVVSGTEDKYAADAEEIVDLALSAFGSPNDPPPLSHVRAAAGMPWTLSALSPSSTGWFRQRTARSRPPEPYVPEFGCRSGPATDSASRRSVHGTRRRGKLRTRPWGRSHARPHGHHASARR